jgi:hypothetical protein
MPQRLHLSNSVTTVAVIDYQYSVTEIYVNDDDNNNSSKPQQTAAADPLEELSLYFDVTDIKSPTAGNDDSNSTPANTTM